MDESIGINSKTSIFYRHPQDEMAEKLASERRMGVAHAHFGASSASTRHEKQHVTPKNIERGAENGKYSTSHNLKSVGSNPGPLDLDGGGGGRSGGGGSSGHTAHATGQGMFIVD